MDVYNISTVSYPDCQCLTHNLHAKAKFRIITFSKSENGLKSKLIEPVHMIFFLLSVNILIIWQCESWGKVKEKKWLKFKVCLVDPEVNNILTSGSTRPTLNFNKFFPFAFPHHPLCQKINILTQSKKNITWTGSINFGLVHFPIF